MVGRAAAGRQWPGLWRGWSLARSVVRDLGREPAAERAAVDAVAQGCLHTATVLCAGDTRCVRAALQRLCSDLQGAADRAARIGGIIGDIIDVMDDIAVQTNVQSADAAQSLGCKPTVWCRPCRDAQLLTARCVARPASLSPASIPTARAVAWSAGSSRRRCRRTESSRGRSGRSSARPARRCGAACATCAGVRRARARGRRTH